MGVEAEKDVDEMTAYGSLRQKDKPEASNPSLLYMNTPALKRFCVCWWKKNNVTNFWLNFYSQSIQSNRAGRPCSSCRLTEETAWTGSQWAEDESSCP